MIYLDWAATAPPIPEIQSEASGKAGELFANPSSPHALGKAARSCIEGARDICASSLDTGSRNIFFSSSGTESNNIIFSSLLGRKSRGSVVVTGIEHPSVYEPARSLERAGFAVKYIQADSNGVVDPERFAAAVDEETVLAAIMLVNNETGAIQPVGAISRLIREKESHPGRVHIHTDAVQAFGKIKISCKELGVDSLSASAHKIGALRGAGILFLGRPIETIYRGGEQEGGVRAGTENLQAIFGLGRAVTVWENRREEWNNQARELRTLILDHVSGIPGARLFDPGYRNSDNDYSPYIISVSFPPIPGEVLVRVMSDRGFAISTGSACSSKGKKNLRVLKNMGIDTDFARSAIRVSTGTGTRISDCETFCSALERETTALRTQIGTR